jgi:hypothetical protein
MNVDPTEEFPAEAGNFPTNMDHPGESRGPVAKRLESFPIAHPPTPAFAGAGRKKFHREKLPTAE